MDTYEAARFIEGLALKPGWKITAYPANAYGYGAVHFKLSYSAHDTSEQYAPGYRVPFRAQLTRAVLVTPGTTEDDIVAQVLKLILEIETHEWQETIRYQRQGRWHAPFHPHQVTGVRRWLQGLARPSLRDSCAL